MKKVKLENISEKDKENALNEIRIIASISNKNIIGYKDSFIDENQNTLNTILEFCDDGDLY
jgi:NIMA (never in mitosis gene a)-related kinase